MESCHFSKEDIARLLPICDPAHSDSANLDSMIEILVLGGRSLAHAIMMVIPEAWQENDLMPDDKRAFYEYHASIMEPWDGPASICFTDGNVVGATLDRNGLRPSRYCLTSDDKLVMASEAGAFPVDQSKVILKGRLQPGKMFIADLDQGRIISDEELKKDICNQKTIQRVAGSEYEIPIRDLPCREDYEFTLTKENLLQRQMAHGFTSEDLKVIFQPMVEKKIEPLGRWVLILHWLYYLDQSQHLSNYFKQLFAQVSNPPIDPIRERLVMSLFTSFGSTKKYIG